MSDMYNPQGANFHNKLPMKEISRLNQLDGIEDIHRYRVEYSLTTYYPVKCTPSISVDYDSEIPVIMTAGDIVSIKSIKSKAAYTSSADAECGIALSGMVPLSLNVETGAVMSKDIDLLYNRDMSGFIVKANGGNAVDDHYSANDATYGILKANGAVPSVDDNYNRAANKPNGIMGSRVMADMRYRYLNYDVKVSGYSIIPAGVLTLPVVIVAGSGVTSTVVNAVNAALDVRHQYILLSGATEDAAFAKVASGQKLMSSSRGKFVEYDGVDADQIFGKILEKRIRVPYDMSTYDESFPGSQIKGTDTAGLSKRLYIFIDAALKAAGITSATKEEMKTYLYSSVATTTAGVSISFSNVDVAFGYLAK